MEMRHYKFSRITLNPEKCFGKPCIRNLRIPVASILSYLGVGMTVEDTVCSLGNGRENSASRRGQGLVKFLRNMNVPRSLGGRGQLLF
jgi:hypothetical protein